MNRSVSLFLLAVLHFPAGQPALAAERYALVIGIDGYQELGKLTTCVADAKALAKVLVERCRFPEAKVVLLTDDAAEPQNKPTLGTIRRRIGQFRQLTEKGDTILLFFSGHGLTKDTLKPGEKEGFLIPIDGDPANAISVSWVVEEIEKSAAATKLLVLDTCHAGAAKGVGGIAPSMATTLMLLSCGKDQVSYPDEATGHSIFSRFLLEGMQGGADANKDKGITIQELADYVKAQMRDWCLKTGKTQVPEVRGTSATTLRLAEVSEEPKIIKPPELEQEERTAAQLAAAAYPVFATELEKLKATSRYGDAFTACRQFLAAHLGTPEAEKVQAAQEALRDEFQRLRDDHAHRFRQAIEKGDLEACRHVIADLNQYDAPEIREDRNRMLAVIKATEQKPALDLAKDPKKAIHGKVTGVDKGLGLVIINVGQRHKVSKGDTLIVFRGADYVGKLVVDEVFPDMCATRYNRPDMRSEVEVGDDATTELTIEIAPVPKEGRVPLVGADPEQADGKVIVVEADGQHVMVDLGRKDWVEIGMLFSVFEGNDPKSGRERGQIQIRRVFDVIAQAKVLKQDENNPLLPGMIIANPAFQRGRKLTFVLSGAFRERKIKEFLARYPCGIAGKVTRETDYVVAGEGGKAGDSPPEVAEAKRLGITVMTESQLLRYLGEAE